MYSLDLSRKGNSFFILSFVGIAKSCAFKLESRTWMKRKREINKRD
jgi:hypothetical protein